MDTTAEDPAQLYYSSGTTGLAKGILHAHRYLLAHEEFIYCHDVQDGELFHGMGEWAWAAGICPLLGPWRFGAVQAVYQREGGFDPHKQLEFLSRHSVSNVFATPTAIRSMMGISDAGTRYPQKFRIVCSAGEPLNPEAIRWFRQQYGITVLDYYGLTESYPLCANYPFMEVREGSMGRPAPGWEVAILDEDERPVARGERGEICLKARSNPHYPLGYWNRPPEDSEETFGGDWFHTKDAASEDEDGYYWYEGRADDVIISAGYRIGPFEVESACLEHPAVAEAAAVGVPDERRGTVVKAFVVLASGHEPSDALAEEIKAFVREHLSAYAYPRQIEFVADLPKTLTGKIRRIELRQRDTSADRTAGGLHWRTLGATKPQRETSARGAGALCPTRAPQSSEQIKNLYEESESRTADAFEQLVKRDSFGELLAKMTENVVGVTKIATDTFDLVLRNLRLAGRQDITRLARQLSRAEDKLELVLQEVEALRRQVESQPARRSRSSGNSRSSSNGRREVGILAPADHPYG